MDDVTLDTCPHLELPLPLLPLRLPPLLGLAPLLRDLGDVTPLVHDLQPLLVAQGVRVADAAPLALPPRRGVLGSGRGDVSGLVLADVRPVGDLVLFQEAAREPGNRKFPNSERRNT